MVGPYVPAQCADLFDVLANGWLLMFSRGDVFSLVPAVWLSISTALSAFFLDQMST